jgi:hypothetical protein
MSLVYQLVKQKAERYGRNPEGPRPSEVPIESSCLSLSRVAQLRGGCLLIAPKIVYLTADDGEVATNNTREPD